MTFDQWIEKYLDDELCLSADTAQAIKGKFKESPVNTAMQNRWNDVMDGYPPQLIAALRIHLNTVALEHLRENQPMHFMIGYLEAVSF